MDHLSAFSFKTKIRYDGIKDPFSCFKGLALPSTMNNAADFQLLRMNVMNQDRMRTPFLITLFLTASITSCTQTSVQNKNAQPLLSAQTGQEDAVLNKEQLKEKETLDRIFLENDRTESMVTKKLDDMFESAKQTNPDAIKYLASDLFLKSHTASQQGDWQTSKIIYKYLLQKFPNDLHLKMKYGESLIRLAQLHEAQLVFEDLEKNQIQQKIKDKDDKTALILAGIYEGMLDRDRSRAIYEKIIRNNPKQEEACLLLSKSYTDENQLPKAISIIDQCLRKNSQSAALAFHQGKIYLELKNNQQAFLSFTKALKSDPKNEKIIFGLGTIYEEMKKYPMAVEVYKNFLDKNPSNILILNKLTTLLFILERSKEAIPYMKAMVQMVPDDLNIKVKLAILLSEENLLDDSKALFEEILEKVPQSDKVLFYLAAIYQQQEQFSKTVEYLGKIPADSPLYENAQIQTAQVLMNLVTLKQENKDPHQEEEKQFFSFVEERSKTSPELAVPLKMMISSFYENQGRIPDAISVLESLKDHKNFDDNHRYYLATLYEKIRQYEKAYQLGHDIVQKNPMHAHTWNFLGYSLLERNIYLDKAYEFIQRAVTLRPDDGYIRDSLGWYFFKTGKMDLALHEVSKAHKLVPNDPVVNKHLGTIYKEMKRPELAKKYYSLALDLNPQTEDKEYIQHELKHLYSPRLPASIDVTTSSFQTHPNNTDPAKSIPILP
jgi:tetratricopeptide (TPR) repeat protein